MKPIEVTDMDIAFGPHNVQKYLPEYSSIPEEFKNFNNHTKWNDFISDCFFSGAHDVVFEPKDDINPTLAWRHIRAILRSWSCKHEHKEAGCAYLCSLWFNDVKYKKGNKSE